MNLKYSNIDINNCNREELLIEIDNLKQLYNNYNNFQIAQKLILNSFYGIFGNEYFIFYNKDIAESITTQCRDLNFNFVIKKINEYFKDYWFDDLKCHEKLKITVISEIEEDVIIYGVTDSFFINFDLIIDSTNYNGKKIDFILDLYNVKLKKIIKKITDKYSEKYNTDNLQNLKLETIFETCILINKNHYMGSMIWKEPNIKLDHKKNIVYKGIDIIKKSTPIFIRKKLDYLMNFIITSNNSLELSFLIDKIKTIKEEYLLEKIHNISIPMKVENYDKYVLNDRDDIEIKKNTPIWIKGSAIYNYLLNQSNSYKKKYYLIKSGDKVKYYLTKDNDINVFSFLNGSFPIEINPPEYDYEQMFLKSFLNPLNQILQLIYKTKVPENLITTK